MLGGPLTVVDFISAIRRQWIIFLSVLTLSAFCSAIAFRLASHIYEAQAWLIVDTSRNKVGDDTNDNPDRVRGLEQLLRSQVAIIQSEEVIRQAIRNLGARRLLGNGGEDAAARRANPPTPASDNSNDPGLSLEEENAAYIIASHALTASVEPNTLLIRITYRAHTAALSADFVNAVVASYLDRYLKIFSNPQAVPFFEEQGRLLVQKAVEASTQLQNFMIANNVYSIDEQLKLLLERRDKASADLLATRGTIAVRRNEINSLKQQLASLRTTISLPVEIYGSSKYVADPKDKISSDPPLLHVKLYQESVESLVNKNSEIAGLEALADHQEASLSENETELKRLSGIQAEFLRLRKEVNDSETYVDLYNKKGAAAHIDNAWRSNERLSSIQVMQSATIPLVPVFPKTSLFLGFGTLLGFLAASGAALFLDRSARQRGPIFDLVRKMNARLT
jgi:succinoglycan biosynthesis transport protein ExoP